MKQPQQAQEQQKNQLQQKNQNMILKEILNEKKNKQQQNNLKKDDSSENEDQEQIVQSLSEREVENQEKTIGLFYIDQKLFFLWNSFFMFLLLVLIIVFPYVIAFKDEKIKTILVFKVFLYVSYLANIFITMNTAKYDIGIDELQVERPKLIQMYTKSFDFYYDIFCLIPLIFVPNGDLFGLLMTYKIPYVKKQLKDFFKFYQLKKRNYYFIMISKKMQMYKNNIKIAKIIINFFLVNHLASCVMWLYIMKLQGVFFQNIKSNNKWPNTVNSNLGTNYPDNDDYNWYINCFYFILQTTVTTGYGDVSMTNQNEQFFAILWMFVGCFFQQIFVGSLTNLIQNADQHETVYQQQIDVLEYLIEKYSLNRRLINSIKDNLKEKLFQDQQILNNEQFLNKLPINLKIHLLLRMNVKLIQKLEIFEKTPAKTVTQFLEVMSLQKFKDKEIIFQSGDAAKEVFFLVKGKVIGYLNDENYANINFMVVKEGQSFGDVDILNNQENRTYNMIAKGITEIMSLSRKQYLKIMNEDKNDDIINLIQHTINKQQKINILIEKAKKKYYSQLPNHNQDLSIVEKLLNTDKKVQGTNNKDDSICNYFHLSFILFIIFILILIILLSYYQEKNNSKFQEIDYEQILLKYQIDQQATLDEQNQQLENIKIQLQEKNEKTYLQLKNLSVNSIEFIKSLQNMYGYMKIK